LNGKVATTGLENQDQRPWGSIALTTRHPLFAKVGLTSPTSGARSVGIVRLRTKATGFSFSNTNRHLVSMDKRPSEHKIERVKHYGRFISMSVLFADNCCIVMSVVRHVA
jgi:hypothetical protein